MREHFSLVIARSKLVAQLEYLHKWRLIEYDKLFHVVSSIYRKYRVTAFYMYFVCLISNISPTRKGLNRIEVI